MRFETSLNNNMFLQKKIFISNLINLSLTNTIKILQILTRNK